MDKNSAPDSAPYHHGNLRASLVAAAIELLARVDGGAPSLREVARLAGVSIAAVYRHFPSKEALLAEVAVDGFARLNTRWRENLPDVAQAGAEQRFQLLGEHYVQFALAAPAHYRLMFEHQDLRRFPDLERAARDCFLFVLDAAAATVREAGADARWALPAANAAWALVHGYVMLSLGGRLTLSGATLDLPATLLPRFLRLPPEALPGPR